MITKTTLNLKNDIIDQLDHQSQATQKSPTELIVLCLRKNINIKGNPIHLGKAIRYQPRDATKSQHRLHVSLLARDYEYCQDLRRFLKISVSFIVSISVNKYLQEIVNELTNETDSKDNYQFIHYLQCYKLIEGVICWTTYWGLPENLTQLPPN